MNLPPQNKNGTIIWVIYHFANSPSSPIRDTSDNILDKSFSKVLTSSLSW